MNALRIYAIFLRQFYLNRRSVGRIFGFFYWTTLDLLLWGLIMIYISRLGTSNFAFAAVILGTIILWNFLTRIQHGITVSFLEDTWTRNFINLFSSPLTLAEYATGLVLTSLTTALISVIFMAGLAWFLFAYNIFQYGFMLLPLITILFVFGWALGLFTTAIILRLGPSSEILAWSIPALLGPISGVFYPISTLPVVVQKIAAFIPVSHVFEGMRQVVLTGSFDAGRLILAGVLSFVFFLAAYWFLVRSYRRVLRLGLFIRFMTD
ncbi:MAG: ABC-2 type transporter, partial [Parcubacteria group bacterium GW2011_GWA2_45_30]